MNEDKKRLIGDSKLVAHRGRELEISYFLHRAQGAAALYLHGLGGSKEDFIAATEMPRLCQNTLLAFDFPGFGKSPYPAGAALGLMDLAEIARQLAADLGIQGFTIIGHSMGGLVGLLLASTSNHVTGFMNVEGNLSSEDCFFSREASTSLEKDYFSQFEHRLRSSTRKGFPQFAETFRSNVASERAWYDYCRSIVHFSDNSNLVQLFIELKMPRLFVYGSDSSGLHYLETLKRKGVELISIPDSDHFPFYTNPELYYEVVAGFLESE